MTDATWLRFYGTHGTQYAFNLNAVRKIEDLGEGRVSVDGETVYADFEELLSALPSSRLLTSDADPRAKERAAKNPQAAGVRA